MLYEVITNSAISVRSLSEGQVARANAITEAVAGLATLSEQTAAVSAETRARLEALAEADKSMMDIASEQLEMAGTLHRLTERFRT